jgi:hypothetical protein
MSSLVPEKEDEAMEYRFVTLTSSGEAGHGEDWSCASDVEAIERASCHVPSFGAELWRGDHRISVFAGPMSRARPDKGSGATPR